MAEELKELLEKIRREGIDAAEEKRRMIENAARASAEEIVRSAEKEASRIISDANARIAAAEASGKQSLKQAARNALISLHQEIAATLDKVITMHVHKALGAEELTKMILALVKEAGCTGKEKTIIALKKEDLEKLEKSLLGELGAEAKKGIVLRHGADIKGGFTISYDSAKSYFDFTDRALAEYIAAYMKPKLAKILEEASGPEGL
jgi:V/A-type H+-transporting ATPase subunit E